MGFYLMQSVYYLITYSFERRVSAERRRTSYFLIISSCELCINVEPAAPCHGCCEGMGKKPEMDFAALLLLFLGIKEALRNCEHISKEVFPKASSFSNNKKYNILFSSPVACTLLVDLGLGL
jgi:hypothetical protein